MPPSSSFAVAAVVTVALPHDQCPEYWGDQFLFWCRRNGILCRWVDRGIPDAVSLGFASEEDAAMFRMRAPRF